MAASGVAVGFEWTAFAHGFVFWEYPDPEHRPPADEAGQQEWLAGFQQAYADYPDEPHDPDNTGERGDGSGSTRADAGRQPAATGAASASVARMKSPRLLRRIL